MCLIVAYLRIIGYENFVPVSMDWDKKEEIESNQKVKKDLYLGGTEALLQLLVERSLTEGAEVQEERRRAPSLCENWRREREAIALLGMT